MILKYKFIYYILYKRLAKQLESNNMSYLLSEAYQKMGKEECQLLKPKRFIIIQIRGAAICAVIQ